MKAFQFRLETLLKLRARETEQKAEVYSEAMNARMAWEARLQKTREHYLDLRDAVLHCRGECLVGVAQTSYIFDIEKTAREIARIFEICDQAAKIEEKRRQEYITARQEEETLKKLKQKAHEKYLREFYKHEDKQRDDLTSARMSSTGRHFAI